MAMNIQLDGKLERQLEDIARSSNRTVDEVLAGLVAKGLEGATNDGEVPTAEDQRRAIETLCEEIDRLPVGNPDDGFCGADHDRVIYRRDW